MGRPEITEDQRNLLVELLANAIRKDAHVRARAHSEEYEPDLLRAGTRRHRAEASKRYTEGMRDIVRVLFLDGYAIAEECLEEAYAKAMGLNVPQPFDEDKML